jgi:hypothetical protein
MPAGRELFLELGVEHFLEQILEAAVIGLEDRVLGGEVERPAALERIVHAGAAEIADRILEIVHRHGDARAREVEHFAVDHLAVLAFPDEAQLARAGDDEVGRAILIAISVTADHDRVGPARDQAGHVLDDDRLAEDGAAEDVADRAVGRLPHALEVELGDAALVGRDRRALNADAMFLDRIGAVDRDLIVGLVALLDREVIIFEVDVEIGEDQAFANPLPDDPRHLIAVNLDDGGFHLDLSHACSLESRRDLTGAIGQGGGAINRCVGGMTDLRRRSIPRPSSGLPLTPSTNALH